MNYINGKIYKITDIAYTKMYIGSTTQSLAKRFSLHKSKYKLWQDGKFNKLTVFDLFNEFGIENCKIELIEEFPCDNRMELERKEGEHIKNSECVNKRIEGRTKKEYRQDNKEEIKEYQKQYYFDNKDKILDKIKEYRQDHKQQILENNKQYYQDNKDKVKQYYQNNKDKILDKIKEYQQDHKQQISENKSQRIQCICGAQYIKCNKSHHFKTTNHINKTKNIQ